MTRLLAVDIGEHELRLARGERRFGAVRVTSLERIRLPASSALPDALATLAAEHPGVVMSVVPAAAVAHRFLTLPFRDRRRLARTVPLELLGQLPCELDGGTIAFEALGAGTGGTQVLAALVRGEDVAARTSMLTAAGIAPTRLDLAPLPVWNLLPAGNDLAVVVADGRQSSVSVRRAGQVMGLRALGAPAADAIGLAAEVRWSLAGLGGAPATVVLAGADGGAALAGALAGAIPARIVPLAELSGTQCTEHTELAACAVAAGLVVGAGRRTPVGLRLAGASADDGSLRRVAALAAAALLLGVLDLGIVRWGLARRDAALTRAIASEAAAALPGVRLVAPRAQLEAAAGATFRHRERLGAQPGVLDVLRDISSRVPPSLRLDLDEVGIERDAVVLRGRAETFDAVDALRRELGGAPTLADVTAEETRATVDGRRVEFRVRAARRHATGASS